MDYGVKRLSKQNVTPVTSPRPRERTVGAKEFSPARHRGNQRSFKFKFHYLGKEAHPKTHRFISLSNFCKYVKANSWWPQRSSRVREITPLHHKAVSGLLHAINFDEEFWVIKMFKEVQHSISPLTQYRSTLLLFFAIAFFSLLLKNVIVRKAAAIAYHIYGLELWRHDMQNDTNAHTVTVDFYVGTR